MPLLFVVLMRLMWCRLGEKPVIIESFVDQCRVCDIYINLELKPRFKCGFCKIYLIRIGARACNSFCFLGSDFFTMYFMFVTWEKIYNRIMLDLYESMFFFHRLHQYVCLNQNPNNDEIKKNPLARNQNSMWMCTKLSATKITILSIRVLFFFPKKKQAFNAPNLIWSKFKKKLFAFFCQNPHTFELRLNPFPPNKKKQQQLQQQKCNANDNSMLLSTVRNCPKFHVFVCLPLFIITKNQKKNLL